MTPAPRKSIFRFIDPKGRLTIASLIAIAVYLLAFPFETGLRISLAYDVAVAAFLALHTYRINRITAQDIQHYYQDREPSNSFVVVTAVVFSSLSLVGVGFMSRHFQDLDAVPQRAPHGLLVCWRSCCPGFSSMSFTRSTMPTGITTWTRPIPTLPVRKGLSFPNDEPPDYWDFLYYSFTIAMCYQTSDVTVCSRSMRRITLFHAVISFLYVTAILGLVINILSNEI